MAKSKTASKTAEPAWPAVPAPGHAFLTVSPQELDNILARVSEETRGSLLYIPGEGEAAGRLQYPESCAAEILAIDKSDARPGLVAYARDRRWEREVAGTVVDGVAIRTDRETRSALLEAQAAIALDPAWSTPWELPSGASLRVDAGILPAIIAAVAAHRRAAFEAFETVKAAIDAGAITSTAEIDAAFA